MLLCRLFVVSMALRCCTSRTIPQPSLVTTTQTVVADAVESPALPAETTPFLNGNVTREVPDVILGEAATAAGHAFFMSASPAAANNAAAASPFPATVSAKSKAEVSETATSMPASSTTTTSTTLDQGPNSPAQAPLDPANAKTENNELTMPQTPGHPVPAALHLKKASHSGIGASLNGSVFVPGACGSVPSSLGYQCSWAAPHGIILHWSHNVAHPPINRCTTNKAVPNAEAQHNVTWLKDAGIHFALQAATKDKLHLAFVGPAPRYYPSEGVHTGTYCRGAECSAKVPQVEILYHTSPHSSEVTGNRALRDPNLMEGWAAWASADFDDLTGVLCFSRRAKSKQMRVGADIVDGVTLSYAVNSKTPYTYHAPRLGIVRIDFRTGTATLVKLPHRAIRIHGMLMLLAFAVCIPAGLLSYRHSWWFIDSLQVSGLTPTWTLMHMGAFALGAILGLTGMIVAFASLGSSGPGAVDVAHQVAGLCAIGSSVLLSGMYGLRPLMHTAPGSANLLLGVLKALNILTVAGGWTTLFTGCIVARDNWAIPLDSWMPLCAIICGLVAMVAVALELRYQKLVRSGAYNPKTHLLTNSNPLPLARIRTHREPTDPKKEPLLSPNKSTGMGKSSPAAANPDGKETYGSYAKGPVHVLATAEGMNSTSSGNSTPSSVSYRGRPRNMSINGVDSGFPSYVSDRGHM